MPFSTRTVSKSPEPNGQRSPLSPPAIDNNFAAFNSVSSHSDVGLLDQVIPAPEPNLSLPAVFQNIRIATLNEEFVPSTQPRAPQYGPRKLLSLSSINLIAELFGAPLTEPGGNNSSSISRQDIPSRSSPITSETRCSRPGCNSLRKSSGTCTEPDLQILAKSLRIRSTIITFSAKSLSENFEPVSESLRVPLIGLVLTVVPDRSIKSSGDAEAISRSGNLRKQALGAGFFVKIFAKSGASERSFSISVLRIRQALTW
ncbi:unannotated protein [freshwater metagenome]|uniref:Unannotated protein n=1 Tax=freshwater metagenome TaxID=449393 RepID=A0A6J6BMM1_9ZZZZ